MASIGSGASIGNWILLLTESVTQNIKRGLIIFQYPRIPVSFFTSLGLFQFDFWAASLVVHILDAF